jgi:hypothetical protein
MINALRIILLSFCKSLPAKAKGEGSGAAHEPKGSA